MTQKGVSQWDKRLDRSFLLPSHLLLVPSLGQSQWIAQEKGAIDAFPMGQPPEA